MPVSSVNYKDKSTVNGSGTGALPGVSTIFTDSAPNGYPVPKSPRDRVSGATARFLVKEKVRKLEGQVADLILLLKGSNGEVASLKQQLTLLQDNLVSQLNQLGAAWLHIAAVEKACSDAIAGLGPLARAYASLKETAAAAELAATIRNAAQTQKSIALGQHIARLEAELAVAVRTASVSASPAVPSPAAPKIVASTTPVPLLSKPQAKSTSSPVAVAAPKPHVRTFADGPWHTEAKDWASSTLIWATSAGAKTTAYNRLLDLLNDKTFPMHEFYNLNCHGGFSEFMNHITLSVLGTGGSYWTNSADVIAKAAMLSRFNPARPRPGDPGLLSIIR